MRALVDYVSVESNYQKIRNWSNFFFQTHFRLRKFIIKVLQTFKDWHYSHPFPLDLKFIENSVIRIHSSMRYLIFHNFWQLISIFSLSVSSIMELNLIEISTWGSIISWLICPGFLQFWPITLANKKKLYENFVFSAAFLWLQW